MINEPLERQKPEEPETDDNIIAIAAPDPFSETQTLARKLNAVNYVARRHLWPDWFRCLCLDRMAAGHRQYGDGLETVRAASEALEETADKGNFCAFAWAQGRWSRGWSVVAWLVGIGARLVRREVAKEDAAPEEAPQ